MKREYLFRAKEYSGDDDEPYEKDWIHGDFNCWVYGDLRKDEQFIYGMIDGADTSLMPDTLGMWCGMYEDNALSKSKKLIYEGDIVCFKKQKAMDSYLSKGEVIFEQERAAFVIRTQLCSGEHFSELMHDVTELKVIGNIYDNPELLHRD